MSRVADLVEADLIQVVTTDLTVAEVCEEAHRKRLRGYQRGWAATLRQSLGRASWYNAAGSE